MFKDFAKIESFLTVVREKSFSKASSKLGISQPAVTQQIKFIEDYLGMKILERKKSGITLTIEGKKLYAIAQKIEKSVNSAEKEILKIIKKDIDITFGTSFIIGNYIFPKLLKNLEKSINSCIKLDIAVSNKVIKNLLDKKIDIALVDNYIANEDLLYREWREDEIVIFSNQKLPITSKTSDLISYKWVCSHSDLNSSLIINESMKKPNKSAFDSIDFTSDFANAGEIIDNILNSNKNDTPEVSIISRSAIETSLKDKTLYESKIGNTKITKKLYIAYRKESKHDAFIENVVDYILKIN
ncbi:MAG: LysR family transcriptional regulator [Arcobacter sp.]|nr:LysR family transcriptional regulator [Arcobacter sp.]